MKLRSFMLAAAVLLSAVALPVLGQGPLHKRVDFSIDSPFELKQANAVLPAGNYVLYQLSNNDPALFALYSDDMTNPPIAMIRTTRIDYTTRWPQHTKLILETDETSPQNYPMLEGWRIPGDDGFEVVAAVAKRSAVVSSIH